MKNEDPATTTIESKTRKIPSVSLLGLAIGSMIASGVLMLIGDKKWKQWGLFIGQWAPSILVMGTYNKIAKTFSPPYDEEQRARHGDNASPIKAPRGARLQQQPV